MKRSDTRARWTSGAVLLGSTALLAATLSTVPATADTPAPSPRQAAQAKKNGTVLGVYEHLFRFEEIGQRNGGNRASGLPGYRVSKNYVVRTLKRSGYKPTVQDFEFPFFRQTAPSVFERTAPTAESYVENEDYALMTYSATGDVTAAVQGVDLAPTSDPGSSTSGCEPEDFAGFTAGNIALLQRGACAFGQKVANAQDAGAVGAIVFNTGTEGNTDAFAGTLGAPQEGDGIPAIGTSYAIGQELTAPGTEVHLASTTESEIRTTWNVLAQTRKGRANNVVMAGAHLDSVPEGHGINDNGSGSAALLETAQAMADMKRKPKNKVRFAWWGAEELGLLGSEHYVADLAENRPRKFRNIALYLNFDMVGSPNYMLGVYDGNDSLAPDDDVVPPSGSAAIERKFRRIFTTLGTTSVDTEFSGRSDYGPFIALNVPAGGLFTGAEGIKSAEEAEKFGGTAGEAYDSCYHQGCDDIDNVSYDALKFNNAAILRAVKQYSRSTRPVNGNRTGHQAPSAPTARGARAARSHGHDHNDVVAR